MSTRRFRTAALALLAAGFLTYLAYARVSGTEPIRVGMPLLQAQLIMLSPGEQTGVVAKVAIFTNIREEHWLSKTSGKDRWSHFYQWEDATHRVNVRAEPNGPFSTLQIVELDREPNAQPELGTVWAWRIVLTLVWLGVLVLLFRAAFEPKHAVALNSPGAPGASSGAAPLP
ncbi:hypothetical protein [Gemmata sp.]|uniref:hypothetical protein n=1 Tax=Gemmata sp. TaxID=1914242 RepID=UPI003F71819E